MIGAVLPRVATIAEMQARDLSRRRTALILLAGLPLAFYGALAGHDPEAIIPGGIAMAFALSGAAIFTVLSSRAVDQRLALAGYRTGELLGGRLLFLEAFAAPIVGGSSAVMTLGSAPPRPGILLLAVALVAGVGVPFGLLVGTLLPRELEATLVLIGVVGIQLTLEPSATMSKLLPFYGTRQLLSTALGETYPAPIGVAVSLAWAAGLFTVAAYITGREVRVRHHPRARTTVNAVSSVPVGAAKALGAVTRGASRWSGFRGRRIPGSTGRRTGLVQPRGAVLGSIDRGPLVCALTWVCSFRPRFFAYSAEIEACD